MDGGCFGYEPVSSLDPMAAEALLRFTTCSCNGDCSNQRCCCKKISVKRSSACRNSKGMICENFVHDDTESGEDTDLDY